MINTKIEWCDSTVNVMAGCNGCELWGHTNKTCYAGILTSRFGGKKGWPVNFETPKIFPHRFDTALKWKDLTGHKRPHRPHLDNYPRTIFFNDMGDTFTESLSIDWLVPYIAEMGASPHLWIILTKRPKRMFSFFAEHIGFIPANFWLMTTVTSQVTISRVVDLIKLREITPDVTLGVSAEPLFEMVQFGKLLHTIDWLIVGGESGTKTTPLNPDWVRSLRDQSMIIGTPFFFKQWGGRTTKGRVLDGQEWSQMPNLAY